MHLIMRKRVLELIIITTQHLEELEEKVKLLG